MRWKREIRDAFRARGGALPDDELVEELAQHLQDRWQTALDRGNTEEEARALVAADLARVTMHATRLRRARTVRPLSPAGEGRDGRVFADFAHDVRYAARVLAAAPGFTVILVLTVALGIGIATTVLSAASTILVRPLGFPDPDRLVMLHATNSEGRTANELSFLDFQDIARDAGAFEGVAASLGYGATLSGGGEPRRVEGLEATPDFLDVLGVRVAAGRTFIAVEGTAGHETVALISHRLWQTLFAGDGSALGRQVLLNDVPHTVVGILPAGFADDIRPGLDVVVPTTPSHPLARSRAIRTYQVIARLRPGVSIDTARAALATIGARLEAAYPDTNIRRQFTAVPLIEEIVGNVRAPLTLISWAVAAVLLLVCANVANLLLARATWRRREMAVRLALGARRGRLVRQVLTESLLVAAIGGAAGAAFSYWLARALLRARGAGLPRVDGDVEPYVVVIGVAVTLVVGLVVGLLPAVLASKGSGIDVLRDTRSSGSRSALSLSKALVVVQTGIAVLLLSAAGVLSSSLYAVLRVPAGFDTADGVSMRIDLPDARYPTRAANAAFFAALTGDVAKLPFVRRAGVASALPLSGQDTGSALSILGRPTAPGDLPTIRWQVAAPGYFGAMGVPLLSGRDYTPEDLRRPHVSIVSAAVEREFFPGESAVGKRIYCGVPSTANADWHEIIGVVGDVRHARLDSAPQPRVYDLLGQHATGSGFLVVRAADIASALPEVRAAIRRLDPGLAVYDVRTLEEMAADSVAPRRFLALLIGASGVLSLVIAAVGIYGVVGYIVARRRHEMGIRLALGAAPGDLKTLVLKQGLTLAVGGIVTGSIGAAIVSPLLGSQLFGARSAHASALAAGALVFVAVSLLASYLPARRATLVDPLTVLRHE